MKKKLFAMLCCLTLAAASLTGCGGGSTQTGAEATGTGEAQTQAPAASGMDGGHDASCRRLFNNRAGGFRRRREDCPDYNGFY